MLAYKTNKDKVNKVNIFRKVEEDKSNEELNEPASEDIDKDEEVKPQETLQSSKNKVNIGHVSYQKRLTEDKSYSSNKQAKIPPQEMERVRNYLISEHQKVLQEAFLNPVVRAELTVIVTHYITTNDIVVKGISGEELTKQIVDAVAGMGKVQRFVEDFDTTDIMINGLRPVIIERNGKKVETDVIFESQEELREIASKIVNASGETLTAAKPYVDCQFPSMRINITDHHISGLGLTITIRKSGALLRINNKTMLESGQANKEMITSMEAFIKGGLNVLIVGPTGSGKTELMKYLFGYTPRTDRSIILEDTPEMYLHELYPDKHVVPMNCRFTDDEETTVDFEVLLKNLLRQYPTRAILGESRGPEALLMLEILNTGHPGMTSIHANSARDAVDRLVMMCLRAGVKLDREIIAKWVTRVFDIVYFQKKLDDGSRVITETIELIDFVDDNVVFNPLFSFENLEIHQEDGITTKIVGEHKQQSYLSLETLKKMKSSVDLSKIEFLISEEDKKELNII